VKVFLKTDSVREILIRKNMSQNWLAHKLFISSGYMSQLMDRSRCPSAKVREKLMAILQISEFDELFIIEGGS
jgi:ribosome-binding protein aMBF1 (putative translation factor)